MLSWLEELHIKDQHRFACGVISAEMNAQNTLDYEETVNLLTRHGAHNNLFMFLSEAGGSGKSHVIRAARKFCSEFCRQSGLPFEKKWYILRQQVGQQQLSLVVEQFMKQQA